MHIATNKQIAAMSTIEGSLLYCKVYGTACTLNDVLDAAASGGIGNYTRESALRYLRDLAEIIEEFPSK